jgi:hypothetical protein
MQRHSLRVLVLVVLGFGLGGGCGSVLVPSDGGGGSAGSGAAGHGGAGTGGVGGQRTDSGVSCTDLQNEYTAAMSLAQTCEVDASGQCQQLASTSLSPCFVNCMTYVNDASDLDAIKQSWTAAGCDSLVGMACPAIACLQPTQGLCVASDGGGAVCSSGYAGVPTPAN